MSIYEYAGRKPEISKKAFVHPQAVVIGNVKIDDYCYIAAGAVLRGDFGEILIGEGSNVQENAVIHTKPGTVAKVCERVLISHAAVVHGPCLLKPYSGVGMGAVLCPGCVMETESYLAAGALLKSKTTVPEKMLAAGNPAVIKKKLSPEVIIANHEAIKNYIELSCRQVEELKLLE